MCAHELNLSSLYIGDDYDSVYFGDDSVGDDSVAKTTTKKTLFGSHGAQYRQNPWSWQFQNLAEVTAQRA